MKTQTKPRDKSTASVDQRNLRLSFDFARAIVDDPSIVDEIPDGATLVLIPNDDPELAANEIEMGITAVRQGRDVYFRHVRHMPDGQLDVKQTPDHTSEATS